MRNRIISALVGLSMAVSSVLPGSLAMAAPMSGPATAPRELPIIQVGERDGDRYRRDGYRHRRDGDRYRGERRADRRHGHRWRDDRRGYRYDRRYDHRNYRRHGHRHYRHYGDNDDTAVILGGIALGTLLLLSIIEHDRNYDRDRDYRR
jgi:hypothetical protein